MGSLAPGRCQTSRRAGLESVCVFGHDGLLFIHPRAPNLIGLRSAGTMPT